MVAKLNIVVVEDVYNDGNEGCIKYSDVVWVGLIHWDVIADICKWND
jgi:hypothetical protein